MIFLFRTYQEISSLRTFEERFNYLKLNGSPSFETFGGKRSLNQILYNSPEWKKTRKRIIARDLGCDLGIFDRPISKPNKLLIHHLNPISIEQVINHDPIIFDPNNLITVSHSTHNAIHYGDLSLLPPSIPNERKAGDTKLW